jgi:polyhydroxyalkanoate synthesis regulator phasin
MEINEIKFLKQFFQFQVEKGKSLEEFEIFARATLVDTGQISEQVFKKFLIDNKNEQEIAKKELQIKALESQIKELQNEIKSIKKKQDTVINNITFIESLRDNVERDACGHPISRRSSSSGCGGTGSSMSRSC